APDEKPDAAADRLAAAAELDALAIETPEVLDGEPELRIIPGSRESEES
ncbi:MAG: hypothetical protein ACI8W3_000583, partial [Myxococcota bacterium]